MSRSLAALRTVLAAALLVLSLAAGVAGCQLSCPAALLEGVLERRGDDLVVVHADFVERVDWGHSHHDVRERDGQLIVVDWFGSVQAREGDHVRMGGGEAETGVWGICGSFGVVEPAP